MLWVKNGKKALSYPLQPPMPVMTSKYLYEISSQSIDFFQALRTF